LPPIRSTLCDPRLALAGCLALALGACHAADSIDVTRRTSLSPAVKGAPFLVLLSEDEGSDPSYRGYAAALAGQLRAQGLAGVNDPKQARYAVMLERDWPHKHPASDASSGSADGGGMAGRGSGGGGFGGGGHHHGGGGGLGRSDADTHDTALRIAVFDLSKPNSPQEQVFFASAHAPVGQDENDAAIDTMIQAALKDFPGKPHETFSVALPAK
jgi:hypothetical protein